MGLEDHQKEGVVFGQAKTILTEQFQNGEESRRKCDPQEVSKSMGLERDQGGARIFHPDEVLTAQQITSFFGRLAAKKQLLETTPTESDNDGNDSSAAEAEAYHSTLCTYVRKRCLSSASGCVIRFQCM